MARPNGQGDWMNLQPGTPGSRYPVNMGNVVGRAAANMTTGGWSGGAQAMTFRDPLDALRGQMGQRIPSAQYPSGYVDIMRSRREDKLLKALGDRVNQKSYQRGVHKGERLDPGDYFWPVGGPVDPEAGLRAQAVGTRWTAKGSPVEHILTGSPYATDSARALLRDQGISADPPVANPGLRRLGPRWR